MDPHEPASIHARPFRIPCCHPLVTAVLTASALGLLGCGDGPAAPSPDAGVPLPGACDPLDPDACPTGEKCSVRIDSELPFETRVTCVPDGNVRVGGGCGFGPPGPTGYDNCTATSFCLGGVCTSICADQPDGCAEPDMACTPYGAYFGDPTLGLCTPRCDLVDPDACDLGEGCYLRLSTGDATCNSAGVRAQGEPCTFLNACEPGLGCVLLSPDRRQNHCTTFCDPDTGATSLGGTCADALGAQAAQPACVRVAQFYDDASAVPDHAGMCLDCAVAGYADLSACTGGG